MSEQNKIPCAVAQDLMPLVIDGAASEQSRQAVAQHVAACSACSQIYREMQTPRPRPSRRARWSRASARLSSASASVFVPGKSPRCAWGWWWPSAWARSSPSPSFCWAFVQDVPLSWAQDLQLVRTTQGALLLQFTPAPQYKQHYGWRSLTSDQGEAAFTWRYPWIERVLGRTLQGDVTAVPSRILKTADGRWADMGTLCTYRYQNGKFYEMILKPMTAADFKALEEKGVVPQNATAMWRQCECSGEFSTISMQAGRKKLCIYSAENGEIPLCDAETQAAFDAFIADNPGYYYWDGDLQQAWQNGSLYVPMEGETEGKE
ncbi:MAG: zf-HC2 domain-containing protein [Christensenellales bacterium]